MPLLDALNTYMYNKVDLFTAESEMQTDSAPSSEQQDSATSSSQSSAPVTNAPAPRKKLRLTYEQYKQLANMLVLHMRKQEESLPGR